MRVHKKYQVQGLKPRPQHLCIRTWVLNTSKNKEVVQYLTNNYPYKIIWVKGLQKKQTCNASL